MSLEAIEKQSEKFKSRGHLSNRIAELRARCQRLAKFWFLTRPIYVAKSLKQTSGQPAALRQALALSRLLSEMPIEMGASELVVGRWPQEPVPTLDNGEVAPRNQWNGKAMYAALDAAGMAQVNLTPEALDELLNELEAAEAAMSADSPNSRFAPTKMCYQEALGRAGYPYQWRAAHVIVDYPKVLRLGLGGPRNEAASWGERKSGNGAFYEAVEISLDAFSHFIKRHAELTEAYEHSCRNNGESQHWHAIAEICIKISEQAPETFREALQLLWFCHLCVFLERPVPGNSLGRFDQYMFPFYRNDLEAGTLDEEQALELVQCFWIKLNELVSPGDWRGYASQNVTVGGLGANGLDSSNDLTVLALQATEALRLRLPHLSVRVHKNTPGWLLTRIAEIMKTGIGHTQVYNDEVIPRSLERQGVPRELAVEYAVHGCIELSLPGYSAPWTDTFINLPWCVLLALNNGKPLDGGPEHGPPTGEAGYFKEFETFYQAWRKQLHHFRAIMAESLKDFDDMLPEVDAVPFESSLISDCLARGRDAYDGGARYTLAGIYGVGFATTVDSLVAIQTIMENDGASEYSLPRLCEALKRDFDGEERLQRFLLNAPKYGNDDEEADGMAQRVANDFCCEVLNLPTRESSYLWPILSSWIVNVPFGGQTPATPDGRRAGRPLSNTLSPSSGMDCRGPTAVIHSVCNIDFTNSPGGAVLNIRFLPRSLNGTNGTQALASLIKTYISMGGLEIQVNCVDTETLRQAQNHPERFSELIVRVTGFCARFVNLARDLQEEIIKRTELGL